MEIPINLKDGKDSAVYDKTTFRKKYAKLNYIIKNLSVVIMIVIVIMSYIVEEVNLITFAIALLCVYYYVLSKYYIKEKEDIASRYALVYDENNKIITEVMYINVKDSCLEVYNLNTLSKTKFNNKEIILQGNISVTKDYICEEEVETREELVDTVAIPRVFVSEIEKMFYIDKGGEENEQEHI